jgi:enoyl-CoA hydratase/carnithine racemase
MRGGVMSWIKTIMVTSAVCGVLAGGVTSSALAAENGHIQEVIKHAKEGITHEKEVIKHLEEASKSTENAHAKEALEYAKASLKHAEESLVHTEGTHQPAKNRYAYELSVAKHEESV